MNKHDADPRGHLWELIKDIKFGMLTTHHSNGHLHSRPLTTQNQKVDEDTALWFFISRASDTAKDLADNPSVVMTYADPGKDSYVSVSGTGRIVEDMAKKKQLWSLFTQAWFPGGVDDPDLALMRLDITHADYWDVKTNKVVQLLKMATAAVSGKPPENMGNHQRVDMR